MNANKCKNLVSAIQNTSDPTISYIDFSNNDTVTALNLLLGMPTVSHPLCAAMLSPLTTVINVGTIGCDQARHIRAAAAGKLFGCPTQQYLNALTIATTHAIADTSTTSIFIMEGVDVVNKCIATTPLTINLSDGTKVKSSHVCDIEIHGLPTVLMGHIVPLLTVASLIGICPLCKAGCKVVFDDKNVLRYLMARKLYGDSKTLLPLVDVVHWQKCVCHPRTHYPVMTWPLFS